MATSVIDVLRSKAEPADMREAALAWAARGFKVFPIAAGTKKPLVADFPAVATGNPDEVRALWTDPVLDGWALPHNVGVLTGGDLLVLDVDTKRGKPGLASLAALELGEPTLTVRTPSGGQHLYFRTDREVANSADHPGPGLDVRGRHGYVLAPGSATDVGRYEIERDAAVAAAPPHLLAQLAAPRERADTAAPAADLDTPEAIERAREFLRTRESAVEGQGGDDWTYRTAAIVKDMGLSAVMALDVMLEWNERCAPPWSVDELEAKVDNAFAYGLSAAGSQSVALAFAGIGEIPPPRYVQPQRAPLQWSDDPGGDQPIRWLLKGILPRNGVGIIYGAPKSGKSFVAFDLSARLAAGLPWFNVRTPKEPIGALLLLGEGAGTVRTRLQAFRLAAGTDFPPLAWASVANLSTATGLAAAREIIADAAAGMASRGLRLGMIVVDTLASALGLEDENSAPEVTAALKALEALAAEFDVAVLGIHHAGKNGQDRGSSAFRAACDVMLAVERSEPVAGQANNHRQISVVLNRNGEGDWSANFTLDRVVLGIDEDGDEITSCTVRPAGAAPAAINRREIVMGQFDPCTIHLHGDRLPGDRWGMTRRALRERCARQWDHLSADAVKKAVQRCVAELLENGRLREEIIDGDAYLVPVQQAIGGDIAPASLF